MDFKKYGEYTPWDIIQPLKKKEILSFETTWMILKGIVPSETSQSQERYCMIVFLWDI